MGESLLGSRRADEHFGALALKELCGVVQVSVVSVHCLSNATVRIVLSVLVHPKQVIRVSTHHLLIRRRARSSIIAIHRVAISPAIVGRGQRASIIVAKFDDHVVSAFDRVRHCGEPSLTREAPCRSTCNGIVGHSEADVVWQVGAPTGSAVVVAGGDHGAVASHEDGGGSMAER